QIDGMVRADIAAAERVTQREAEVRERPPAYAGGTWRSEHIARPQRANGRVVANRRKIIEDMRPDEVVVKSDENCAEQRKRRHQPRTPERGRRMSDAGRFGHTANGTPCG